MRLTSQIKNSEAAGRIIVNLEEDVEDSQEVQIKDGDELIIPELPITFMYMVKFLVRDLLCSLQIKP